jgi:uncharacterized protein (DUF1810 family)
MEAWWELRLFARRILSCCALLGALIYREAFNVYEAMALPEFRGSLKLFDTQGDGRRGVFRCISYLQHELVGSRQPKA